jgi:hypothetical protein
MLDYQGATAGSGTSSIWLTCHAKDVYLVARRRRYHHRHPHHHDPADQRTAHRSIRSSPMTPSTKASSKCA